MMKETSGANKFTFSCSNVVILKVRLFSIPTLIKPPRPQVSRVVDFSKNNGGKPLFCGSVSYGESISNLGKAGVSYDESLGYWVTAVSSGNTDGSGYNRFHNQSIAGDFFLLMEDIGDVASLAFIYDNNNFGSNGTANNFRYLPGVPRILMPRDTFIYNDRVGFDILNCNAGGKYKMIYGGFTWPVNAVLSSAGFQTILKDSSGNITTGVTDPSIAAQNATKKVCAKLKSDWGANLRVYVILYRKQGSYKNKISGAEVPFDSDSYSYLSECAGPGNVQSSTSAPYMYDVSNEAGLKAALSDIAADIKTFATYKEAKNVE
jgi:hypothetical protein